MDHAHTPESLLATNRWPKSLRTLGTRLEREVSLEERVGGGVRGHKEYGFFSHFGIKLVLQFAILTIVIAVLKVTSSDEKEAKRYYQN